MTKTIILRFRDLVTPPGGNMTSIMQHSRIAAERGAVWWSWWKRQTERLPTETLEELQARLTADNRPIPAFGFDSGQEKLFYTHLHKMAVAQPGGGIRTPNPHLSPSFCHDGEYAAWFLFGPQFLEVPFADLRATYHSFPTSSEPEEEMIGRPVKTAKELRKIDATFYVVEIDESCLPATEKPVCLVT